MSFFELQGAFELGLVYGFMALGVFLSFRVLNYADLTVDGSFPMGAAIAAALIVEGVNPILATLCATTGGALAGCVTAWLNTRLGIMDLLTGILTMTGLYSINLRIMGKSNIPLFNAASIFPIGSTGTFFMLLGLFAVMSALIIYFLRSQIGLGARASGSNPQVSTALGIDVKKMKLGILAISNGLVAFSGALFCQYQGFADAGLGVGTIVAGLASVMIGEACFKNQNIGLLVLGCFLGSIIYRVALALALNIHGFGFKASDMKLLTALFIVIIMLTSAFKNNKKSRSF